MLVANDHIAVVVDDLDAMVRFYTETIGLKVNKTVKTSDIEITYLGASTDESQLELLRYPAGGRERGLVHYCYEVKDLPATCAEMKDKGAEFFIGPKMHEDGSGWLAFFRDPEGNIVELVEPGVLAMEPDRFS